MKKIYTLAFSAVFLTAGSAFSQNFSYTNVTSLKTGNPGDELIMASTLINSTSSTLSLRVTRQQDVMTDAPTWTSAFCMDVCYLPSTDSVSFSFPPMDTVDFTFHMYTDPTPDHARAQMRWKNVNNPSNTFNQAFVGVTDGTAGMNELSDNSASVSIYPMPLVANDIFTMVLSNAKNEQAISMVIYNTLGSVVSTRNVIAGINLMDVNLPGGVYSYSINTGNSVINSGKLVVTE